MIRTLRLSIAAIACTSLAIAHANTWTPIDKDLEQLIALINDSYSGEYREARTVLYPDDTHSYVLTFFAIEGSGGGNNGQMYMAQWWPNWSKEDDIAGENQPDKVTNYSLNGLINFGNSHTVDPKQTQFTDDYHIIVHGMTYGQDDARCCPSVPITLTYDIEKLELVDSTVPKEQ